jgi:hypothetical protein
VMEQQTAPAKANREYRPIPVGAVGSIFAPMAAFAASILDEPVPVGGADVAIMTVWRIQRQRVERRVVERMDGRTEIASRQVENLCSGLGTTPETPRYPIMRDLALASHSHRLALGVLGGFANRSLRELFICPIYDCALRNMLKIARICPLS